MNLRKRYLALFITTGTIFLAGFALSFIFELNGMLKEHPAVAILLIILVPAVISAAMFFFMRFTQETQKKINLENENLYALGKKTTFFNLASFESEMILTISITVAVAPMKVRYSAVTVTVWNMNANLPLTYPGKYLWR